MFDIIAESRTHAGGGVFSWELPQETPSNSAQPDTAPVPIDTKTTTQKLFDPVGDNSRPNETANSEESNKLTSVASPPIDHSTDWYNITAIGNDEPLKKLPEVAQRPSFRRSVSGDSEKVFSFHSLLGGVFSQRTVGDTTPSSLGRHKSASQLNVEDDNDQTMSTNDKALTGSGK